MGSAETRPPREQLRGFCTVADTCVAALTRLPEAPVIAALQEVGGALDTDAFEPFKPCPSLTQRFYDRFFVPTSPAYVPLCEDSIRGAQKDGTGAVRYAPMTGRHHDHVVTCYEAAGFDFRAIEGLSLAVQNLRPTSLASELAFVSSLAAAADGLFGSGDEASAQNAVRLARAFVQRHASRWFGAAAEHLARFEDDLYARVCRLAAEAVETLGA